MVPSFVRINTQNQEISFLQNILEKIFSALSSKQIIQGLLIEDVDIQTGSNEIPHGLNRKIQGYIIVKKTAAIDVYHSNISLTSLTLESSTNATVSIWIF